MRKNKIFIVVSCSFQHPRKAGSWVNACKITYSLCNTLSDLDAVNSPRPPATFSCSVQSHLQSLCKSEAFSCSKCQLERNEFIFSSVFCFFEINWLNSQIQQTHTLHTESGHWVYEMAAVLPDKKLLLSLFARTFLPFWGENYFQFPDSFTYHFVFESFDIWSCF